jgi:hypothetical protein
MRHAKSGKQVRALIPLQPSTVVDTESCEIGEQQGAHPPPGQALLLCSGGYRPSGLGPGCLCPDSGSELLSAVAQCSVVVTLVGIGWAVLAAAMIGSYRARRRSQNRRPETWC